MKWNTFGGEVIEAPYQWRTRDEHMRTLLDRYRGCLLGLAVGDALGTTLEFTRPGTFAPITDMVGGGPFGLKPGQWTDDTSMALCLAESLIVQSEFNPVDQLERYCRWYHTGYLSSTGRCFDIGATTRQSLLEFERERRPYPGSTSHHASGNGSLMRLAPVPMRYRQTPRLGIDYCADSSRTTHGSQAAVDACRYFGGILIGALEGTNKELLLSQAYSPVPDLWLESPLHSEVEAVAAGSFKRQHPPEISGSGYVVKCLEAALWAFEHSSSFEEGALKVVNLGDDADTTGAVYGQIAGAFYGESGIPKRWLDKLTMRDYIGEQAEKLLHLNPAADDFRG